MAPTDLAPATDIRESELPGPYPVGSYAAQLKRRLLEFARVQLVGEVWDVKRSRARVYFELRDVGGALPCSMWLTDFEALDMTLPGLISQQSIQQDGAWLPVPDSRTW